MGGGPEALGLTEVLHDKANHMERGIHNVSLTLACLQLPQNACLGQRVPP